MTKRTKALDISKKVKDRVWERDEHCCVICGSPYAMPNAHYIARSQSGLGIEQNIVTLCMDCHTALDHTPYRKHLKEVIRGYLSGIYEGWNEEKLRYRKWGKNDESSSFNGSSDG